MVLLPVVLFLNYGFACKALSSLSNTKHNDMTQITFQALRHYIVKYRPMLTVVEIVPGFKNSTQVMEAFEEEKTKSDLQAFKEDIELNKMSMVWDEIDAEEYMSCARRKRIYMGIVNIKPSEFERANMRTKFAAHMNMFRGPPEDVEGCVLFS